MGKGTGRPILVRGARLLAANPDNVPLICCDNARTQRRGSPDE